MTALWWTWIAAFIAFEAAALIDRRKGDTLSEHVREWFRTNTPRGRLIFGAGWVVFAGWFLVHILWQ